MNYGVLYQAIMLDRQNMNKLTINKINKHNKRVKRRILIDKIMRFLNIKQKERGVKMSYVKLTDEQKEQRKKDRQELKAIEKRIVQNSYVIVNTQTQFIINN